MQENKIIVICGATASGKTGLAVDLARQIGSEIISADCMLIYKGLNIGTAKPTEEEKAGIPHHMIDVISPTEKFSVSDYEQMALPICEKMLSQGKMPIVCGGTGFYIQSILFERQLGNAPANESIRLKYDTILKEKGKQYLHEMLKKADPESAAILHENDVKRVIRALEIYELTGKKKSAQKDTFLPRFHYIAAAIDYPRDVLYQRINERVDRMLKCGLVEEVRSLLENGVQENDQSMQGIGYKEVIQYLKNDISYSTMCDIIKQNTRNYAKRQFTFYKKFPNLVWIDSAEPNKIKKLMELL